MPINPINEVLITLDKPLQDEIILEGGLKLYQNPNFRPEWNSTIVGQAARIPKKYQQSLTIQEGDTVVFGYDVVSDRDFHGDAHYFQPSIEGNEYFQQYVNHRGEQLNIVAMKKVISLQWAGTYIDKYGELKDGYLGDEAGMGRWKAQFSFGYASDYTFKNLLETDGQDYWRCDIENIFAKKVDGELLPTGSRLILEPIKIDIKQQTEILHGVPVPYQTLHFVPVDRGTLTHDDTDLGLKKGDVVSFEPQFCERYQIDGKEYYLIKSHRAMGVWKDN